VQTGAQNEVAIQQRTGLAKKGENVFAHFVGRFCETLFMDLASDTDALQIMIVIISPGRVICRVSILIRHSNNFDFHIHALGQC
jgi:hypothetical protein